MAQSGNKVAIFKLAGIIVAVVVLAWWIFGLFWWCWFSRFGQKSIKPKISWVRSISSAQFAQNESAVFRGLIGSENQRCTLSKWVWSTQVLLVFHINSQKRYAIKNLSTDTIVHPYFCHNHTVAHGLLTWIKIKKNLKKSPSFLRVCHSQVEAKYLASWWALYVICGKKAAYYY